MIMTRSALPAEPVAEPRPKRRRRAPSHPLSLTTVQRVGLGLLVFAAGCLALYAYDSRGAWEWAGGLWKGDLLLPAAGVLGCYGGLLLFLKRFSIAALWVSIVLAVALTSFAHDQVHSIVEDEEYKSSFWLPDRALPAFMSRAQKELSPEAMSALNERLVKGGYASARSYEALHVRYTVAYKQSVGKQAQAEVSTSSVYILLGFEFCPRVYKVNPEERAALIAYAGWMAQFEGLRALGEKPDLHALYLNPPAEQDALVRLYMKRELLNKTNRLVSTLAQSQVDWNRLDASNGRAKYVVELDRARTWLLENETDAERKEFLEAHFKLNP
ncbi:MAG: hypothetical protein AMXMBFR7_09240 [Planctomycetota bacterium]